MIIPYFFGALVVVGVFLFLKKFYLTNARRMTSRTIGTVQGAEERVVITATDRHVETVLTVNYAAGGRDWTVTGVIFGDRARHFPAGRTVPVKYNPANPDMAEVAL